MTLKLTKRQFKKINKPHLVWIKKGRKYIVAL